MTEFFAQLDLWSGLALVIIAISLWLLSGGINLLKKAGQESVDEDKLRHSAWGGLLVGLVYLVSYFY